MPRDRMTPEEKQHYKVQLYLVLTQHIGRTRCIGMGELYEEVFGEPWNHRINDTRRLRTLISELRGDGVPIVSSRSHVGGGYYLASAGSELDEYCLARRAQALGILRQEATLRKMALPELVGQVALDLRREEVPHAG